MGKETSRGAIERGIDKTRKEFGESKKKFERDVKTKKVISETARSATVEGTDEGMKRIKKMIENAGDMTERQFERDDKDQEKVIKAEAQPREKDLSEMTKKDKADAARIQKAISSSQIDAPKQSLKDAQSEALEDADFTEKKRAEQERDRKGATATSEKTKQGMKSAPVKFRR